MNTILDQAQSGYAPVNGLNMYYEIHGEGQSLVLLHGALTTIETSFGEILPLLVNNHQVIAVEMQAHGRTADVDRPLSYEQMADDIAALLKHLNIENADIFGYSMGAGVALQIAIRHPELARKLVLASVAYSREGVHPGILEGIGELQPEHLSGTPWEQAYQKVAPNPENWATLIDKIKHMDTEFQGWPSEWLQSIKAPVLTMIADSDIVCPEHAVEMFRLFGGGVAGDVVGLPQSQLAILPGATHVTLIEKTDWLYSMITPFLDAPMPENS